jgi:rhodanese-related sulfurtransferase
MTALTPDAFELLAEASGALILDTRDSGIFYQGFVPQSVNIGVNGDFAPWVGALIGDVKQEILLITEPGMEEEVITRLSRVGFDHVLGFLEGGFEAWEKAGKEADTVDRINADEFKAKFELALFFIKHGIPGFEPKLPTRKQNFKTWPFSKKMIGT